MRSSRSILYKKNWKSYIQGNTILLAIPLLIIISIVVLAQLSSRKEQYDSDSQLISPQSIPSPSTTPITVPISPPPSMIQQTTRIPTQVKTTPLPTATIPVVSPTPGELGFHVPDTASASITKGDCGKSITITSNTSTSFRLSSLRDPSQPRSLWNHVRWQNEDTITIEKGSASDQFICVDKDVPVCNQGSGCNRSTFVDITTGAQKDISVCLHIKC